MRYLIRSAVAFSGFAVIVAATGPAQAVAGESAFVSRVGGKGVTLSRGEEKLAVRVQTLLAPGDRVTAADGSFVEVTYLADGCILKASSGRSVTIVDASPCGGAEAAKPSGEAQAQLTDTTRAEVVPAAATADSARVTDATGPLARANLGQGLVEIRAGMVLTPGDTVFAGQDSTITLQFPDAGCSHTVAAQTYLQIAPTPPCVPSENLAQQDRSSAGAPTADGDDDTAIAIGAVVLLGGGAAAAFLLTGDDGDDSGGTPVTPD